MNIVCIASGRGSNVGALLREIDAGRLAARIVLVISNNSTADVLDVARDAGIPVLHLSEKQHVDASAFAARFLEVLRDSHAEMIVLAGYTRKLPDAVCRAFRGRIINIHPALLPAFGGQGMYGMRVHEAVIAAGETESGATVHYVDEEYDRGAIIMQERVPVLNGDTPETLAERVLEAEHLLLPRTVALVIAESNVTNGDSPS